jgi:hypothetical protein
MAVKGYFEWVFERIRNIEKLIGVAAYWTKYGLSEDS